MFDKLQLHKIFANLPLKRRECLVRRSGSPLFVMRSSGSSWERDATCPFYLLLQTVNPAGRSAIHLIRSLTSAAGFNASLSPPCRAWCLRREAGEFYTRLSHSLDLIRSTIHYQFALHTPISNSGFQPNWKKINYTRLINTNILNSNFNSTFHDNLRMLILWLIFKD